MHAFAKQCIGDAKFYKYLMGVVEPDSGESHSIKLLPCDTMVVAKGIKFSVRNNAYLAFANPNPGNVIIVRGLMQITGRRKAHVKISGSIDTSSLDDISRMREPWEGIYVKKGGKLILENASFYGARVPIQSESEDVIIKNSFFFDADRLNLSNNDIIPISETGYIESFKHANLANLPNNDEFSISETGINESLTQKDFVKVDFEKSEDYQPENSPNREQIVKKPKELQPKIQPNLEQIDKSKDLETKNSPNLLHTDKKPKNWIKPLVWLGISAAAFGGLATYWIVTAEEPEEEKATITLPQM